MYGYPSGFSINYLLLGVLNVAMYEILAKILLSSLDYLIVFKKKATKFEFFCFKVSTSRLQI